MDQFTPVNILDMIDSIGEDELKHFLSDFSCLINPDIERFLLHDAIEFAKKKMSITYVVLDKNGKLAGYFTLTHKPITIEARDLSNTTQKRLKRLARHDENTNAYYSSAFLIAQFGKNARYENSAFTGDILMELTFSVLKCVQRNIGGNVVFLECGDTEKLTTFYESNRFANFGKRFLDQSDETEENYLLQYMRLF